MRQIPGTQAAHHHASRHRRHQLPNRLGATLVRFIETTEGVFNSCVDYGIGTISATVSSGTATVTSSSWPCSLHQGQVLGVPAGTNYTLHIQALSSGGTTLWSGQATSITVNAGSVTNAGTIVMSYVGGDFTQPTVTLIGPNSSPTNTTNVPITDRINIAFSKSMAISTITSTNITLNNGSVPGTVSYDSASKTAAFIPSSTFRPILSMSFRSYPALPDPALRTQRAISF